MKPKNIYSVITIAIFSLIIGSGCVNKSGGSDCDTDIYTVTKTADTNDGSCSSSDCSLREAVLAANTCAGAQTIILPAGTYPLSIAGPGEDMASTGDLDISDDLIINGEGLPIIDAGGLDRIFEVFAPAVVEFNGLSLQGGSEQLGAAIRNHSDLTINDSTILDNIAAVPAGGSGVSAGGGIFNEAGILRFTNLEIAENSADSGGGIHNFATATLIAGSSSLHDNVSNDDGGGLWVNVASSAELSDMTIENNFAGGDGGGVINFGNLTITGSAIRNNQSDNFGGGLANRSDGVMDIEECVIEDNQARLVGGGLFNNNDSITLSSSTVQNNTALADGGGAGNYNGTMQIINSTFYNNTGYRGGAIYSTDDLFLINSTLSGNHATDSGGALTMLGVISGGSIIKGFTYITHSTIAFNDSLMIGGVICSGAVIEIKNSLIASNPGGDCLHSSGLFTGYGTNIDTDGSCPDSTTTGDPLIDSLADNGGPTYTHALLSGSPALNTAADCTDLDSVSVIEDQRGVTRPQPSAGNCDVGSFELELSGGGISPITFTPSHTPVPSDTPTPVASSPPIIRGIKNANCRAGPGLVYNEIGYLLEDETAEAFARNQDSSWVWVANIHHSGNCWVSESALEYDFELSTLQIRLAPPTPTHTPTLTLTEKPPSDEEAEDEEPEPDDQQPVEIITTAPPCQSYQNQENCLKAGCQWDIKGQSCQP